MSTIDLDQARESLREREGRTRPEYIGSWSKGDETPKSIPRLADWARSRGVSDVIWTALPPRFDETVGRLPSVDEVVIYLRDLNGKTRKMPEQYIRRAPRQVKTAYRTKIEVVLGWTPTDT